MKVPDHVKVHDHGGARPGGTGQHKAKGHRHGRVETAIVLQGGRALGAYEYGVLNAIGGGETWENKASAIDNPDPRPGPATFYHGNTYLYTLGAGRYLKNLTTDTGADGQPLNDHITSLYTC